MARVKAESAAEPGPNDGEAGIAADEGASTPAGGSEKPGKGDAAGNQTSSSKRNANSSVSSVYSGNKIRHLKKEDGVPLWRKDIQYDFLKVVFEDEKRVFHKKSDGTFGHTFADIYLDAMAKSSKCSKILKDKLLTERPQALNMAMVCLLVNVGRMNTTLNFFPEMRAQLRTYHSIPSLQAHQDPNAYKQLQDAPRLKSILKGATEDVEQPSTIEDIRATSIPRTNPVNLIFVLSQYAPRISEIHFDVPRDFFDLVMKDTLSSKSRARAFLWLMWWYLESDFSDKSALENPYGAGRAVTPDEPPLKCPQFDILTDEQAELENVDTPQELEFGEIKRKEREEILNQDMAPVITGPKRTGNKRGKAVQSDRSTHKTDLTVTHFILNHLNEGSPGGLANGQTSFQVASEDGVSSPSRDPNSPAPPPPPPRGGHKSKTLTGGSFINRTSDVQYDTDRTRSASPPSHHQSTFSAKPQTNMRINALLAEDGASPAPPVKPKGPGRGNWRRKDNHHTPRSFAAKLELDNASQASSTAPGAAGVGPHGFYLPLNGAEPVQKRSRPLTNHQLLVEKYRKERVDHILDRSWRRTLDLSSMKRRKEGALTRAWKRCKVLPAGYDSDEEAENARLQREALIAANPQAASALEAADTLLLLAGLKRAAWEREDWGEESLGIVKGMRRYKRRIDRWEKGEKVIKKPKITAPKRQFVKEAEPPLPRRRRAVVKRVKALRADTKDDATNLPSSSPAPENGYEDNAEDEEDGRSESGGEDETMIDDTMIVDDSRLENGEDGDGDVEMEGEDDGVIEEEEEDDGEEDGEEEADEVEVDEDEFDDDEDDDETIEADIAELDNVLAAAG